MIKDLLELYSRDLDKLAREINSFNNEENIWRIAGQVKNSSGNLCLHLLGNLHTYIGKILGNRNYTRNREKEFSDSGISKSELLNRIDVLKKVVIDTLDDLKEDDLEKVYPEEVLGYEMTTQFFLIHLLAHLSYHLGQINYLRRVLE